ncbi:hypothetical protein AAX26_01045 [Aliarcobacter thereius]|uniref:Uncharacterized protein n=2 Tax=Aliarcobacter thereius TaxID=544718 RepID=A0A1C0B6H3_9BACT|nr:hypothetical protein [Aliarcobacter thereius]OCL86739.1 hypothetical protein AAX26_01045 [Aliarcobacter thereius]OCL90941.1 hypothetical protein AAX25_01109 [Aliarcobacter thereius]OCL96230.1 hypothetical protein AA347_01721 [Aliarcobacter thereius LMG 24486]OCL98908.1 hypothetical protein AAX29_01418 [Aliarcobacter thereius]QBF15805.1 putative membrane protein [Aliarcobacter thereius LMG 24486]
MQIIIGISLFLIIATVIIYKVNDKFEKKEFIILLLTIFIISSIFLYFDYKNEKKLPNLFTEKYNKEYNNKIISLNYELLNNKVVSSKNEFIYKFSYTIIKDDKELLCFMDNVKINKIDKEYIFSNFNNLKEVCFNK